MEEKMSKRSAVRLRRAHLAFYAVTLLFLVGFYQLPSLYAQSLSGSLTGVVSDQTGAAIRGARVTLQDANKGYLYTSASDDQGRYLIRNLDPGNYILTAGAQGFEAFRQSGIVIEVNENTSINVALHVGRDTQIVNATTEAPLLETQDAALGGTFDRQLVNDLPLVGRDVLTLTYLTPGVTQAQGQTLNAAGGSEGNDLNFVSNGQRNASAAMFVDGVITSQTDPNPGVVRPLYIPSPDEVQEFKVQQGIIRADTGFSGGTVVNVVTRSGSNSLHGTLYDFDQNNAFNANSYSNNYYDVKNQPSNNQIFGAVLGGPVKKDKTFFFLDYNGSHSFNHSSSVVWVPSDAERAGNFAEICQTGFDGSGKCQDTNPQTNFGQLWDPYTSQIVNGDVVSQAYIPYNNLATYVSPGPPPDEYSSVVLPSGAGNIIDPTAQIIMKSAFPEPNIPNAAENAVNYYATTSGYNTGNEIDLRMDQRFSDKDNLIGKLAYGWGNSDSAGCLPGIWDPCSNGPNSGKTYQVALNYSRAVGPRTLLQLQGGIISNHLIAPGVAASEDPSFDPATDLGMPSYIDSADFKATPNIFYSGAGIGAIGGKTWAAWNMHFVTWQIGGNADLQRGHHDIKIGTDWRRESENFFEVGVPAGQFYYGNAGSALDASAGTGGGNSLASLMIGGPLFGADYQDTTPLDDSNPDFDVYVQDTWHVTQKLTLDMGIRYEIQFPETEASNRICWFDPNAPSPLAGYSSAFPNLKGAIDFAGSISGTKTPVNTSYNNIQPRFGVAYQLNQKTVVRGGYGIYYLPSIAAASGITSGDSTGWYSWTGGGSYLYNAGNSYDGATPAARLNNPFPGGILVPFGINPSPLAFVGVYNNAIAVRTSTIPYQQTWTLGVQRDLPAQGILTVYYVGTKGTHLYDPGAENLNHLPASVDSMTPAEIATLANTYTPYAFYGAPVPEGCLSYNITCYSYAPEYTNMLPYPQYDNLFTNNAPDGNSIYHALQVQLEKRLTFGLQAQASYTCSKSIDDSSVVDGNTAYLSAGSAPGAVDPNNLKLERSVSGFNVPQSLTFAYTYAMPFGHGRQFGSTSNHVVNAILGGWNTTGMYVFQSGFPISLYQQNGTSVPTYGLRPTITGVLKKSGAFKKPGDLYFANPSVVTSTPNYTVPTKTVGNAPRFSSSVSSEGIATASIGVSKSFDLSALREGAKFEFRVESFNAFNHPQFQAPNSGFDTGQFGVVNVGQQNSPRQVQLGGKIYF
jgi:Carboxypeptidase regulatory-like domain